MASVTISKEKLDRMIEDVEELVHEVSQAADQDEIAKRRLQDVKKDPSIGKTEEELDSYLENRGVKIE